MADAKVTALTALSGAMTLDDLLYAVNDPGGTPTSRKATAAQVLGLDQAFVRGLIVTKNSGGNTLDISAGYCFDPSSGKVIYYAGATAVSAGTLGASQWNQVYIYDNAGTSTIEVVNNANPPSTTYFGTARQGGTNSNRRWIGSFLTTSGSAIYVQDVKEAAGSTIEVIWLASTTSSPFRVLAGGTATSFTQQSLVGCCPRYVASGFYCSLIGYYATTGAAPIQVNLSIDGTNNASQLRGYVSATGESINATIWHPIEASTPSVYYKSTAFGAGVGNQVYLDLIGYKAAR